MTAPRRPERPEGAEGALVMVATPIGNLGDLSPRAVEALAAADTIAAEDTRRARTLLAHAGIPAAGRLRAVHDHNEAAVAEELIDEAVRGARVVVVTDAGMPGVSDPGAVLVRAAVDAGVKVEVVPGPSAVLSALVLSGLPSARFVFEGFLPRKGSARAERLAELARERRSTVLFEAPHRVRRTLTDLLDACGGDRRVSVSRELTKVYEETWRGSLAGAVEHIDAKDPRGEYTIVVAPLEQVDDDPADGEVEDALRAALADGTSVRDAATQVAGSLGIPRRRAYELGTRISRSSR